MVFSSQLFLFGFVPVFFSLYYLIPKPWKNGLILVASLLFYALGAGVVVIVLLVSIAINQWLAVRVASSEGHRRTMLLAIGVVANLAGLFYYKYTEVLWGALTQSLRALGFDGFPIPPSIPLPVGISFFTFQAISYLVDVYRRDVPVARGYAEFATYHSLFPQLVAGPIVRYAEIKEEMVERWVDREGLTEGAYRFCLGLGKKMIIADNLGRIADGVFALPGAEVGGVAAWVGIFCYAMQIYFDFSGYSDMAIGLGRMMGFHFPENFAQPYRSASITEFWRRWHMTLSRWFRDYVYIPLGGKRRGDRRTYVNLWMVFALCGVWHGAGLTFLVWGLYHGLLLVIERFASRHWNWRPSGIAGTVVAFVLVTIGWVFFRAPSLDYATAYLGAMAFLNDSTGPVSSVYLANDTIFYMAVATAFAFTPLDKFYRLRFDRPGILICQLGLAVVCLLYSYLMLAANSFNPFIYFRF